MKRIVSLLFSLICIICLASGVRGADVAASRFTDWDEISYQPEVAMLVDLGLISGYSDGSFRPFHCVTRAEIAKVITGLLTDTLPQQTAGRFSDTSGTWADPYIQYCADRGIISGDQTGLFRPNDYVTGRELAKMLLAAVGYQTDRYTGAGWTAAVDSDAEAAGIYDGFQADRSRYITREEACLLINHALQCSVIAGYDADGRPEYVLDDMMSPKTLLEHRFRVMLVSGVVEANAVADLRRAGGKLEGNLIHIDGYTQDFVVSEQVALDESLLGHKVTVYAQFNQTYNQVFGMPSIRASEVTATLSSSDELNVLVEYHAMDLTAETQYYKNLQPDDRSCLDTMEAGDTVTVVDHEGDGRIDVVMVTAAPAGLPAQKGPDAS